MLVIGLTGSIASGKSTACKILSEIDPQIPVVDADKLSFEATQRGNLPYLLLKYLVLPADCFDSESGELLRARLAALIFAPTFKAHHLKKIVERCIHPWVIFRMLLAILFYWLSAYPRVVLDIPLLFEVNLTWICSTTVLIDVESEDIQLSRLMKRNPQMTMTEAKNRISAQFSLARKRKLAKVIVTNSGNFNEFEKKIFQTFNSNHLNPNPVFEIVFYLIFPLCILLTLITWAIWSKVAPVQRP